MGEFTSGFTSPSTSFEIFVWIFNGFFQVCIWKVPLKFLLKFWLRPLKSTQGLFAIETQHFVLNFFFLIRTQLTLFFVSTSMSFENSLDNHMCDVWCLHTTMITKMIRFSALWFPTFFSNQFQCDFISCWQQTWQTTKTKKWKFQAIWSMRN